MSRAARETRWRRDLEPPTTTSEGSEVPDSTPSGVSNELPGSKRGSSKKIRRASRKGGKLSGGGATTSTDGILAPSAPDAEVRGEAAASSRASLSAPSSSLPPRSATDRRRPKKSAKKRNTLPSNNRNEGGGGGEISAAPATAPSSSAPRSSSPKPSSRHKKRNRPGSGPTETRDPSQPLSRVDADESKLSSAMEEVRADRVDTTATIAGGDDNDAAGKSEATGRPPSSSDERGRSKKRAALPSRAHDRADDGKGGNNAEATGSASLPMPSSAKRKQRRHIKKRKSTSKGGGGKPDIPSNAASPSAPLSLSNRLDNGRRSQRSRDKKKQASEVPADTRELSQPPPLPVDDADERKLDLAMESASIVPGKGAEGTVEPSSHDGGKEARADGGEQPVPIAGRAERNDVNGDSDAADKKSGGELRLIEGGRRKRTRRKDGSRRKRNGRAKDLGQNGARGQPQPAVPSSLSGAVAVTGANHASAEITEQDETEQQQQQASGHCCNKSRWTEANGGIKSGTLHGRDGETDLVVQSAANPVTSQPGGGRGEQTAASLSSSGSDSASSSGSSSSSSPSVEILSSDSAGSPASSASSPGSPPSAGGATKGDGASDGASALATAAARDVDGTSAGEGEGRDSSDDSIDAASSDDVHYSADELMRQTASAMELAAKILGAEGGAVDTSSSGLDEGGDETDGSKSESGDQSVPRVIEIGDSEDDDTDGGENRNTSNDSVSCREEDRREAGAADEPDCGAEAANTLGDVSAGADNAPSSDPSSSDDDVSSQPDPPPPSRIRSLHNSLFGPNGSGVEASFVGATPYFSKCEQEHKGTSHTFDWDKNEWVPSSDTSRPSTPVRRAARTRRPVSSVELERACRFFGPCFVGQGFRDTLASSARPHRMGLLFLASGGKMRSVIACVATEWGVEILFVATAKECRLSGYGGLALALLLTALEQLRVSPGDSGPQRKRRVMFRGVTGAAGFYERMQFSAGTAEDEAYNLEGTSDSDKSLVLFYKDLHEKRSTDTDDMLCTAMQRIARKRPADLLQ